MKNKIVMLLLFVGASLSTFAQTNLNAYKYVIVPNTYEFLKEENQYQLNDLTEFLFEKKGFEAYMEDDAMPEDFLANGCLGLHANVLNESNLFTTKLKVVLKDCKNAIVFETAIGSSKEKDFKTGYHDALREAFNSFDELNYKFDASKTSNVAAPVVATQAAAAATQLPATIPATPIEDTAVPATAATTTASATVATVTTASGKLYAQPIENGFQLVDSTPKVVYKLKQTNIKDVYFVEGKQATIRKTGEKWVLEYYEGETLKQEVLDVKF